MEYNYYNQFMLSDKLAQTIAKIISKKEKIEYICKTIAITIPEHKGLIFSSPLDDYNPYGGGLKNLSGAQINAINEKYGKFKEGIIPEKKHYYIIVMEKESFETFSKMSFQTKEELENALQNLSVIWNEYKEYIGVFDSRILSQHFEYLQEFFSDLDDWRSQTNRATIDDDILEKNMKKILHNAKQRTRKKLQ